MPPNDLGKLIEYWRDGALYDLENAQILAREKRLISSLFFLHLAVEKCLKAIYVQENQVHAPLMHNLTYLLGKTSLEVTKRDFLFLENLNEFNIRGRYPEESYELQNQLTVTGCKQMVAQAKKFILWSLKKSKLR